MANKYLDMIEEDIKVSTPDEEVVVPQEPKRKERSKADILKALEALDKKERSEVELPAIEAPPVIETPDVQVPSEEGVKPISSLGLTYGMLDAERVRKARLLEEGTKQVVRQVTKGIGAYMQADPFYYTKEEQRINDQIKQLVGEGKLTDRSLPYEKVLGKAIMKKAEVDWLEENMKDLGKLSYVDQLVMMVPQVGLQAGITMLTGGLGSFAAMGLMGSQIVGGTIENLVPQGVDLQTATRSGVLNAIWQAPMEQIGIGKAVKAYKTKSAIFNRLKNMLVAAGTEGITEATQVLPEGITELMAKNPNMDTLEAVWKTLNDPSTYKQMGIEGSMGAIMGAGVHLTAQAKAATLQQRTKEEDVVDEVDIVEPEKEIEAETEVKEEEKVEKEAEKPTEPEIKEQPKPEEPKVAPKEKIEPAKPEPVVEEKPKPEPKRKRKTKKEIMEEKRAAVKEQWQPTGGRVAPVRTTKPTKLPSPPTYQNPEGKGRIPYWMKPVEDLSTAQMKGEINTLSMYPGSDRAIKRLKKIKDHLDARGTTAYDTETGRTTVVQDVEGVSPHVKRREEKLEEMTKQIEEKPLSPEQQTELTEAGKRLKKRAAFIASKAGPNYEADDLINEALIRTADDMSKNEKVKPTVTRMEGHIKKFLAEDQLVTTPRGQITPVVRGGSAENVEMIQRKAKEEAGKAGETVDTTFEEEAVELSDAAKKLLARKGVSDEDRQVAKLRKRRTELAQKKAQELITHFEQKRELKKRYPVDRDIQKEIDRSRAQIEIEQRIRGLEEAQGEAIRGSKEGLQRLGRNAVAGDIVLDPYSNDIMEVPSLVTVKEPKPFIGVGKLTEVTPERVKRWGKNNVRKLEQMEFGEQAWKERVEFLKDERAEVEAVKDVPAELDEAIKRAEDNHALFKTALDAASSTPQGRIKIAARPKVVEPEKPRVKPVEEKPKPKPIKKEKPRPKVEGEGAPGIGQLELEKAKEQATKEMERREAERKAEKKVDPVERIRESLPELNKEQLKKVAESDRLPKDLRKEAQDTLDTIEKTEREATDPVERIRKSMPTLTEEQLTKVAEGDRLPLGVRQEARNELTKRRKLAEGQVLAEAAAPDLGMGLEATGPKTFLITSGAHEGTTFSITQDEPVTADVVKAGERHMRQREVEAARKGTVPTPVITKVEEPVKTTTPTEEKQDTEPEKVARPKMDLDSANGRIANSTLDRILNNEKGESPEVGELSAGVKTLLDKFKDKWTWAGKILDVEYIWKKAGKNKTGLALKNFFSRKTARQLQGEQKARDFMKIVREGMPEGKLPTQKELEKILLAYESDNYFREQLTEDEKKQYRPAITWLENFFKGVQQEFADRGVNVDFKKRMLAKLETELKNQPIRTEEDKKKYEAIFDKILEVEQTNYANIPIAILAEQTKLTKRKKGETKKAFRQRQRARHMGWQMDIAKERHVLSLNKMKEQEKFKDILFNPIEIIINYENRNAKDFALLDIKDAMVEDGVLKSKKDVKRKPAGWEAFDSQHGVLAGHWVHPQGYDMIENLLDSEHRQNWYDRFVARTKVLSFYNPFFMPTYDLIQGITSGAYFGKSTAHLPKNILLALKDVASRTDMYYEAMRAGLFSKPFDTPWDKQRLTMREITKHDNESRLLSRTKTGLRQTLGFQKDAWIPGVSAAYQGSFDIAWGMDEIIRMLTFRSLTAKGMSIEEAAQTAAKFHGDYASVPAKTRRMLNRVLFTPTFKIVMGKSYMAQMNGVMKAAMGKSTKASAERQYAKGLVGMAAVTLGFDMAMRSLGYEPDEDKPWINTGRRYYKPLTGSGHVKDFVLTWSHTGNMYQRYAQRIASAMERSGREGPVKTLYSIFHADVTPLINTGLALLQNKKWDGSPIWNERDSKKDMALKWGAYAINNIVGIVGAISDRAIDPDIQSKGTIDTEKYFKRTSKAANILMNSWMSIMSGRVKDAVYIKKSRAIKFTTNKYIQDQKKYFEQHGKENKKWTANYLKYVKQEMKAMKESKKSRKKLIRKNRGF